MNKWILASVTKPKNLEECIVTCINTAPVSYYEHMKNVPQTAYAVWFNGNWYWWNDVAVEILGEYGERSQLEKIPTEIKVTAWMPKPEPWDAAPTNKITNRDYLINQLIDPDWIDDGGASYESEVYYNIACPYRVGDTRGYCDKENKPGWENCFKCKEEWLDSEVDN